jgi:hypothetical protein
VQGRTTLMIAHRLSTLASCNTRIELGDARVRVLSKNEPSTSGIPVGGLAPLPVLAPNGTNQAAWEGTTPWAR